MTVAPDDRPHVDPATTRIRLRWSWDGAQERTTRLHPAGCHAALLDWQPERWPEDGGMPVEIAGALGAALTTLGTVMGRADVSRSAGPCTTLIPPPRRTLLATVRDGVLRRPRAELLAQTRDPIEAAALLDCGWSMQSQAILVLSADATLCRAVHALRYRSDWRDLHLAPPMNVLLTPSNDGTGAMIAAASAAALAEVVALVDRTFEAAGFLVSHQT